MTFYSFDIYDKKTGLWENSFESDNLNYAKLQWEYWNNLGVITRVREVRDLTSGVRWLD